MDTPMTTPVIEPVSEAAQAAILAALDQPIRAELQGTLDLGEVTVLKKKAAPRKKAPKKQKIDGLQMYAEEPIPPVGPLYVGTEQIGTYHWVTEVEPAVQLLRAWAAREAWCALDLETSAGWRMLPDKSWEPGEGQTEEDRPLVKSYVDTRDPDPKKWKSFGSDPYTSRIFTMQCSVENGVGVVFDMRTLMASEAFMEAMREFLVRCKLVIHDQIFDSSFLLVQFLASFGVYPNVQFCTATAHRLITAGMEKGSENTLAKLTWKFEGYILEKKWQGAFLSVHPEGPLPLAAVLYAAGDTIHLLDIAQKIYAELVELDLVHIWEEMERPLMFWVSRARLVGMRLDVEALQGFRQLMQEDSAAAAAKLEALMPGVNPRSGDQLSQWFVDNGAKLGATKTGKLSTDKQTMEKLIAYAKSEKVRAAAGVVVDLRKAEKNESTYGYPLTTVHRNPITLHIHPHWNQCPTDTGRMSCKDPNLQNVPSRDEIAAALRDGFVAPLPVKVWVDQDGRYLGPVDGIWDQPALTLPPMGARQEVWEFAVITEDYSQFEVRGLAHLAGERKMIVVYEQAYEVNQKLKFYCQNEGLVFRDLGPLKETYEKFLKLVADGKKEKAEKIWPKAQQYEQIKRKHPLVDQLLEELAILDFHKQTAAKLFHGGDVLRVTKDERGKAKTVTFGIPYGQGAPGIAGSAKISVEDAEKLLEAYFRTYPRVKRWLEETKLQVTTRGFTTTAAGRKRFYRVQSSQEIYRELCEVQGDPEQQGKWDNWCKAWRTTNPIEMSRKIARTQLADAQRQATNHPIQGLNADVAKVATLKAGARLYALNPLCVVSMWIHDEMVSLAPVHLAERASEIQEAAMIAAASLYVTSCPIEVSIAIADRWTK